MSLTCVKMSEDVWLTCLTHALSTETEEIMGLLLGDIEYSKDGNVTALIWGASPQSRSDRQKDRVETNPEQLAAAAVEAEHRISVLAERTTRVIGWYHSHPHITVLPSHVDVRTQAMYQLLDSGFIGLIFSCFSEDTSKVGRIQVIAFQSSNGQQNHMPGPVTLSPVDRSPVIDVESSLSSSENSLMWSGSKREDVVEQDTCDSGIILQSKKGGGRSSDFGGYLGADTNYVGRDLSGVNYNANTSDNPITDIDPMEMSESMQEAMHRSNLEISAAEYVRKEIRLHVVPTASLVKLIHPLISFTELQRVLFAEERMAYNQATLQNMSDGKAHPLTFIHHTSTYHASLCKLIEYCLSPAISTLQDRLNENEIRLRVLSDEARNLETELVRGGPKSPRQTSSTHGQTRGSPHLHGSSDVASMRTLGSSRSRKRF